MNPPAAVLAIDGGNSKTDVALVAATGELLAFVRGPGASWEDLGKLEAVRTLGELVAATARAGGLDPGTAPLAAYTSACLAGADLPEDEEELARLVQAQGWSAASDVVNDTFAVLRAGLDPAPGTTPWGVAVTCGAGINCVGVAPDGQTTRYLALGRLSGDWGGGGALGLETIAAAARAADGRGPQTRLREDVARHFGVPDIQDAIIAVYRGQIDGSARHGLVPLLFAAAGAGDEVAAGLLDRQAREIVTMAAAAARRLGLAGEAVPVVLGGSVLAARDPLLTRLIESGLAQALPGAVTDIVDVAPVAGAALLGLDHTAAPPDATTRLRAAFRTALPLAASSAPAADGTVGPARPANAGGTAGAGSTAGPARPAVASSTAPAGGTASTGNAAGAGSTASAAGAAGGEGAGPVPAGAPDQLSGPAQPV